MGISRKLNRYKRVFVMVKMLFFRAGHRRAEYLKKTGIFGSFGEKCYYFPRKLPAEPSKVKFHNNVNIATEVYFCDHDVINHMLNNSSEAIKKLPQGKYYTYKTYDIEIMDNVFVGAKTIIMGNVKIGPNAIVAAGSVVTKDVPPNTVVGGNPARVIGDMDTYLSKRLLQEEDT